MAESYGVRRERCVKCNNLTHSGWNLRYESKGKEVSGRHCFKCKDTVERTKAKVWIA